MADDDLDDDDLDDEDLDDLDEDDEGSSGGGGKKKLILLILLPLLLVIGGTTGAYFAGLLDPVIAMVVGEEAAAEGEEGAAEEEGGVPQAAVFYDLPELLVNLNTGGRKSSFLKIRVALELQKQEDVASMEAVMPRIIDNFQVYLRELRIEDLKGSMGVYRLKEELLTRVNAAVAPARVNDVLFKEMLVQ